MRVTRIECDFLVVPVPIPIRETLHDYGILFVTVETDNGLTGIGFAREHDYHALAERHLVLNDIASFVTSLDSVVPGHVWHEASFDLQRSDYRGSSGIASRALSAVDQALWDVWGKHLGQPVYRLLGGAQDEIELYTTFGLNIYTQDEEEEAARQLLARGFSAFKLQGAHADRGRAVGVDIARVKRLREVLGDGPRIIIDGRNNYSLYQAIEVAKGIEPYGVAYFDEPLYARDALAMRRLKEAVPGLPLAARGRGGNIWDNRDLVVTGAVDVLGMQVLDQGGYTQSVKSAHLAETYQIPIVTGGAWHLQNAHLIAGVTNGWMTEYHAMAAAICERLFIDPLMPTGGRLVMNDRPGLGLEMDVDVVDEARERGRVLESALR